MQQGAAWPRAGVPALVLAPMEGVTDAPMRALLAERGGLTYCVAEFLRVSQVVPPAHAFVAHVPELAAASCTPSGLPVQLQLLGGDPGRLAASAARAVACGARAIDLNFGCPARTVNRHDGGAALLRFPVRLRAIVAAVRAALPAAVPVSAKLRLGYDDPTAIEHNAEMAAEGGAAWLTIHGRTRAQGYRPPAYWRPIGAVRRRLGIPVVANGDIWTLDDLRRCQDESQCEHFMVGRGVLADPWLPHQLAAALGIAAPDVAATDVGHPAAWQALLRRFVVLAEGAGGRPRYLPGRLKQWLKMAHLRAPSDAYKRAKRLDDVAGILAAVGSPA